MIYEDSVRSEWETFRGKGNCRFVSAGHTGYMRLENLVWVNCKVIQIGAEIIHTKQSLHYNQMEESLGIRCACIKQGFHSMMTVCIKDVRQKDYVKRVPVKLFINQETFAEELAEGIKIAHNEITDSVTLYQIEDRMVCGNMLYC